MSNELAKLQQALKQATILSVHDLIAQFQAFHDAPLAYPVSTCLLALDFACPQFLIQTTSCTMDMANTRLTISCQGQSSSGYTLQAHFLNIELEMATTKHHVNVHQRVTILMPTVSIVVQHGKDLIQMNYNAEKERFCAQSAAFVDAKESFDDIYQFESYLLPKIMQFCPKSQKGVPVFVQTMTASFPIEIVPHYSGNVQLVEERLVFENATLQFESAMQIWIKNVRFKLKLIVLNGGLPNFDFECNPNLHLRILTGINDMVLITITHPKSIKQLCEEYLFRICNIDKKSFVIPEFLNLCFSKSLQVSNLKLIWEDDAWTLSAEHVHCLVEVAEEKSVIVATESHLQFKMKPSFWYDIPCRLASSKTALPLNLRDFPFPARCKELNMLNFLLQFSWLDIGILCQVEKEALQALNTREDFVTSVIDSHLIQILFCTSLTKVHVDLLLRSVTIFANEQKHVVLFKARNKYAERLSAIRNRLCDVRFEIK